MHFYTEKHSVPAFDSDDDDNDSTPQRLVSKLTPESKSNEALDRWMFDVQTSNDNLSTITLRQNSQDEHRSRSLRSFRERAEALGLKLAVMTALAKQAHREARILEQQFLVQGSLATLNRQNALMRENNRKTSERLQALIRRAETAVRKHCRPPHGEQETVCATQ